MTRARLLIVSNRLPVVASVVDGDVCLSDAGGGLATGLRPYHQNSGGLWIGWPGDLSGMTPDQRQGLERQRQRSIVPVALTRDHIERYYNGFANRVLWPLLHYLIDRVPVDPAGWDAYSQVNETFADAIAQEYRSGDTIWIHDYQLMLVPGLLRARLPDARIGFFLHIPFPSSAVLREIPSDGPSGRPSGPACAADRRANAESDGSGSAVCHSRWKQRRVSRGAR